MKQSERKLMLHNWHISIDGDAKFLHGIVSGHRKIKDTVYIHTTPVQNVCYTDAEELLCHTQNSIYHCPLNSCNFEEQDLYDIQDIIPDYEELKKKFNIPAKPPEINPDTVLVIFSNFCESFFQGFYCIKDGKYLDYTAHMHIGTFQDSFLIMTNDDSIDIRYFPHTNNLEFYLTETDNMPFYIENNGDIDLYFSTSYGVIKLAPEERKLVCSQNCEKEHITLSNADYYGYTCLK